MLATISTNEEQVFTPTEKSKCSLNLQPLASMAYNDEKEIPLHHLCTMSIIAEEMEEPEHKLVKRLARDPKKKAKLTQDSIPLEKIETWVLKGSPVQTSATKKNGSCDLRPLRLK